MSLRSPLSRVLGSGSAKDGTDHWWMQRMTALALLIVGIWFLASIGNLQTHSHAELAAWTGRPFNAVMLLLGSVVLAWHSSLGVQVVIEDYMHGRGLKTFALIVNKFTHVFLAGAALLAIMRLAVGGSA